MVEEFHGAVRVGSDSAWFGVECSLLHLECGQIGVIFNAALGEHGDIRQAIVVLDDMMKVGVTFAADVLQSLDVTDFRCKFGAAFGVDLAVINDGFEPGKIFAVMGDDNFEFRRVESRSRGGSRERRHWRYV